jgi:hypothetical protein
MFLHAMVVIMDIAMPQISAHATTDGLERIATNVWFYQGVFEELAQNLMGPRSQTLAIAMMDMKDTCVMYQNARLPAMKKMDTA